MKTVVARLDRAIQYAAASRLNTTVSGILGHPVKPGDDTFGRPRIMISTAATNSNPIQP